MHTYTYLGILGCAGAWLDVYECLGDLGVESFEVIEQCVVWQRRVVERLFELGSEL